MNRITGVAGTNRVEYDTGSEARIYGLMSTPSFHGLMLLLDQERGIRLC